MPALGWKRPPNFSWASLMNDKRTSSPSPPARLECQDLWFSYEESTPALRGISLSIHPGELTAIIGQNGSGKTTLAKHFNGLLRPARGRVLLQGDDISGTSIGALARAVGYVFQNPDHQIFSATTWEEIAFGPRNLGFSESDVVWRVDDVMTRFRLADYANVPPAVLSHGLRRKVTIAAVVAMDTQVLILDEPTGGLDWRGRQELMQLVVDLQRSGRTILLISHDMPLVAEYAQRCLLLDAGELVADLSPRELFARRELLRHLHLDRPQVTELGEALASAGLVDTPLTVREFCSAYAELLQGSR